MASFVDVLIPTDNRPAALAVTLACLIGQTFRGGWRVSVLKKLASADRTVDVPRYFEIERKNHDTEPV